MNTLKPLMSSKNPTWETPDCILYRVRQIDFIGLDPCTTDANPTDARHFFTPAQDGLALEWSTGITGGLIYCNPPYGQGIQHWVDKCRQAARTGERVIALLPSRTDTRWFPWDADVLCFWRGRLTFQGARWPAPFPSVIAGWGFAKADGSTFDFDRVFAQTGVIVRP